MVEYFIIAGYTSIIDVVDLDPTLSFSCEGLVSYV
jgi:hypothetical protein